MNPEIDKIASAALDGEATAEELARVADDPSFVAAKAEFGAVAGFLTQEELPKAPAGLAQTQISMAMEQFKADAAQRALLAAQPSLTASTTQTASGKAESKWSMPNWLVPALFSVAVLGGLGIAASNLTGGSNEAADADESAGSAMMAETTEAMEDSEVMAEAMEEDAEEEAMEDSPDVTMEASEDSRDDDAGDAAPSTTTSPATTQTEAAPVPDPIDLEGAAFKAFESIPADEVARLATREPPLDPDLYERCGPEFGYTAPEGAEKLIRVVPFTRESEPAEVLVYETNNPDVQIALILSESCEVLDQS